MNREIYGLAIGVASLVAIMLPIYLFVLVIAGLSFLITKELSEAIDVKSIEYPAIFSPLVFYVAQPVGGIFVSVIGLAYGYKLWNIEAFFKAIFVLFYTGFFPSFLIAIKEMDLYLLFILLVAIWTNDILAYYVGKRFGKRRLLPKISPNKTYEGFLAGVVGGTIVFALLSPYGIFDSLLIGAVTLCVGVAGDYFKSFIKRQVGVKDFSNILGGHGGFLDRFDSLIFAAPIYYWLIR